MTFWLYRLWLSYKYLDLICSIISAAYMQFPNEFPWYPSFSALVMGFPLISFSFSGCLELNHLSPEASTPNSQKKINGNTWPVTVILAKLLQINNGSCYLVCGETNCCSINDQFWAQLPMNTKVKSWFLERLSTIRYQSMISHLYSPAFGSSFTRKA